MPAVFQSDRWFAELEEAIIIVGNGARKVEGDGYKLYRIGPTIRCDLSPHWVSGSEGEEGSEGQPAPLSKHFPVWPPTKGDEK